jgi:hypothetical protein
MPGHRPEPLADPGPYWLVDPHQRASNTWVRGRIGPSPVHLNGLARTASDERSPASVPKLPKSESINRRRVMILSSCRMTERSPEGSPKPGVEHDEHVEALVPATLKSPPRFPSTLRSGPRDREGTTAGETDSATLVLLNQLKARSPIDIAAVAQTDRSLADQNCRAAWRLCPAIRWRSSRARRQGPGSVTTPFDRSSVPYNSEPMTEARTKHRSVGGC